MVMMLVVGLLLASRCCNAAFSNVDQAWVASAHHCAVWRQNPDPNKDVASASAQFSLKGQLNGGKLSGHFQL